MKRIMTCMAAMLLMAVMGGVASYGQTDKELAKQQKAILKEVKKSAKMKAKEDKKDGWKAAKGSEPLEVQYRNYFLRKRNAGQKDYVVGEQEATQSTYSSARSIALTRARVEVASLIEEKLLREQKEKRGDVQTSRTDVGGMSRNEQKTKTLVDQTLHRCEIVLEMYREYADRVEFHIGISYDMSIAYDAVDNISDK